MPFDITSLGKNSSNFSELERIRNIPIEDIRPTPLNPLEIVFVDELANSLIIYGQLEAVRVHPIVDEKYKYELVDGERRHTAFTKIVNEQLGDHWEDFKTIECIIDYDIKNDDDLDAKLTEVAIQRRELTTKEKYILVERRSKYLQKKLESGQKLSASMTTILTEEMKRLGINREQVRRYQKITEIEEDLKQDFMDGKMNVLTASKVSNLPKQKQQELHDYIQEGASKKEIQSKVDTYSAEEIFGKTNINTILYNALLILSMDRRSLCSLMTYTEFKGNLRDNSEYKQSFKVNNQFKIKELSLKKENLKVTFLFANKEHFIDIALKDAFNRIRSLLPDEKIEEEQVKFTTSMTETRIIASTCSKEQSENKVLQTHFSHQNYTINLVTTNQEISLHVYKGNEKQYGHKIEFDDKAIEKHIADVLHSLLTYNILIGLEFSSNENIYSILTTAYQKISSSI